MNMLAEQDYSVQFGLSVFNDAEDEKSFPYIYTLVNHNDDPWVPNSSPLSLANIGPIVKAGQKRTIPVVLDADNIFKLINIRYTAYYYNRSVYQWYENARATNVSDGLPLDTDKIGTPLHHYLSISLSFPSSGGYHLYGGDDPCPILSGKALIPLEAELVQGGEYGLFVARTPYLLPQSATLNFEVTNNHPSFDLTVGAAIYGLKVRV
jgi:hypothetical protein